MHEVTWAVLPDMMTIFTNMGLPIRWRQHLIYAVFRQLFLQFRSVRTPTLYHLAQKYTRHCVHLQGSTTGRHFDT